MAPRSSRLRIQKRSAATVSHALGLSPECLFRNTLHLVVDRALGRIEGIRACFGQSPRPTLKHKGCSWRAVSGALSPAHAANGTRDGGSLGGATAQRSTSGRGRTRGVISDAATAKPWANRHRLRSTGQHAWAGLGEQKQQEDNKCEAIQRVLLQ
jgi:hypothetical protein